jgi:hypothetical protein
LMFLFKSPIVLIWVSNSPCSCSEEINSNNDTKVLVASVYLPSKGSHDKVDEFYDCIDQLYEIYQRYQGTHTIIIGGDLNAVSNFYKNLVKWALTESSVAGTTTLDREWMIVWHICDSIVEHFFLCAERWRSKWRPQQWKDTQDEEILIAFDQRVWLIIW